MNAGPYFCTKSGCPWANFTKNVDWGYLDESNGDCESCRIKCQDDNNCRAFECGSTYCSWWAKGTCDDMRNETIHETKNETCTDCLEWETCRITGILMQLCLEIKLYGLCNYSNYLPCRCFTIFYLQFQDAAVENLALMVEHVRMVSALVPMIMIPIIVAIPNQVTLSI